MFLRNVRCYEKSQHLFIQCTLIKCQLWAGYRITYCGKSCSKKPPTFLPSFHLKQIPTTTTSTFIVNLSSLYCLKAGGGFCAKLKMSPILSATHIKRLRSCFLSSGSGLTLWLAPPSRMWAADSIRALSLGSIGFAVFALVLLSRRDCWKDHMEENPGQWSEKYQMCGQGHYGPLGPSWPTRWLQPHEWALLRLGEEPLN